MSDMNTKNTGLILPKNAEPSVGVLQLIQASLGIGVAFFGGIVLIFYFVLFPKPSEENTSLPIALLSYINIILSLALFLLAGIVPHFILRRFRPSQENDENEPPLFQTYLRHAGSAQLARLSILQIAGTFGEVICLWAIMVGYIHTHPIYWLNMLPAGCMILYIIYSFPTRGRLEQNFQQRLADARGTLSNLQSTFPNLQ